jgi:hypothetical protein
VNTPYRSSLEEGRSEANPLESWKNTLLVRGFVEVYTPCFKGAKVDKEGAVSNAVARLQLTLSEHLSTRSP